jgi:hypothetical protein
MAYTKLLTDLGIVVDDCSVLCIPNHYVIATANKTMTHPKKGDYTSTLFLIPRQHLHRLIKQHTKSYKTHKFSFVGKTNNRKPKTPTYKTDGILIPFNHLTHIQQNSKGILIGTFQHT